MAVYTCIYSRCPFEAATREHILQNSLGARWESAEIVCNEVQQQFSTSIDKALEIGLSEFRVLLGSESGRGGEPRSLKVETTEGRKMLVQSGGTAKLAEPRVLPAPGTPDSFQVEMSSAGDAGWVAKKIRDLYPNVDMAALTASLNEALRARALPRIDPTDMLKLRVVLGGDEFFRGVLKGTFNLLGVKNTSLALDPIFDPVRIFILDGTGGSRTFGRWSVKGPVGLPTLGEFDQLIAVYSRGSVVEAFAQFFGSFHWTFKLASGYTGPEFCYSYCVDPLREADPAEDRTPNVSPASLVPFDEGRTEQDDDVRRHFGTQIEAFLRRHLNRVEHQALRRDVAAAIETAWGPPDSRVLTQADIDRAVDAVKELAARRLELELPSNN